MKFTVETFGFQNHVSWGIESMESFGFWIEESSD